MNNDLQNPEFRERWGHIAEPGWEINHQIFNQADRRRTKVLHCAIPLTQAKRLTGATFPPGWDADKCLIASVGRKALPELKHWEYTPQIRAVPQLPHFKTLPPEHSTLMHSPWFQSPSQATGIGINARHLRYHHQLWNELRPKTLRGVPLRENRRDRRGRPVRLAPPASASPVLAMETLASPTALRSGCKPCSGR